MANWDGENRRTPQKQPWHFKKEVSVGHIITTISLAASVAVWAMKMDNRLTRLEDHETVQKATDDKQDRNHDEGITEVKAELRRINDKLDRFLERQK